MTSNVTSSDDVETPDDKDTVEVQGVVVKLRKKVPRSVEPGGGHEALLSRRMKKSLCGWSQEDISGQFVHSQLLSMSRIYVKKRSKPNAFFLKFLRSLQPGTCINHVYARYFGLNK
jgi:hypothetical protein